MSTKIISHAKKHHNTFRLKLAFTNPFLIARILPSIISDGATMWQPALAKLTAISANLAVDFSISIPSSVMMPQWPRVVHVHRQISQAMSRSGNFCRISLITGITGDLSGLSATLPVSSF